MRVFKKMLCALVAIVLVERIFAFALEPITYYHFLCMDEKAMEANGFHPELVFFGDSRCVRTFIPNVFEKKIEEIDDCINKTLAIKNDIIINFSIFYNNSEN